MVAERPAVALSVMVYCMVISWCFGAGQVLGVLLCMCPAGSVCAVFVAGDLCSGRDRENRLTGDRVQVGDHVR